MLKIIITGGTFDKTYDPIHGTLGFTSSQLPQILSQCRVFIDYEIEFNQLVDSLEMAEENRLSILEACRTSKQDRIIITHGTDTMVETAELIGHAKLTKLIILTGALVPYSITGSDALFNLGTAFGLVTTLDQGVYIAMNGQAFRFDQVQKDRIQGRFVPRH